MPSPAKQKWLLLFNCQAEGLANCLELLQPSLTVDRFDPINYRNNIDKISASLSSYDRVVIAPRVKHLVSNSILQAPNLTWLPHIWFQGYHPDLCYLAENGPLASGAAGPYHSAITYSAFKAGCDVGQAASFFRSDVYEQLGYFDAWESSKRELVNTFSSHGFDVRLLLVQWSRRGPFMHTVNHPHISVLHDLARMLISYFGSEPRESGVIPHDNLINGPVFPVYPEIGARLGVRGHYAFKRGGSYRVKDLMQFISESFAVYQSAGDELPSNKAFLPALQRAETLTRSMR